MEARNLHLSIDYLGSHGVILSPEQKAALQASLSILQNNNKFSKVYFWGKILGIKDDYFIAQGLPSDEMGEKKALYSMDCANWNLLPIATEAMKIKSKIINGRFTGEPSHDFEHVEIKKTEDEDATEEEEVITLKEEERLAAIIDEINRDVKIVPRGAFVKTPTGQVYSNKSFEGLSVPESSKLCNYFHFREAEKLPEKTLLQKANLNKALDFLDPIDEDIPKGSWSLQFERGSALVLLKSLLWVGYSFYQVPGTSQFGSLYVGTGEKNMDLPFML